MTEPPRSSPRSDRMDQYVCSQLQLNSEANMKIAAATTTMVNVHTTPITTQTDCGDGGRVGPLAALPAHTSSAGSARRSVVDACSMSAIACERSPTSSAAARLD